jgi:hypothetical protein
MQIKRFVASSLAALMAGATFAGAALAATSVGGVLKTLGTQAAAGTPYLVVVGDTAAASDVVGAIDVASALAQQVTKEVAVPGVTTFDVDGKAWNDIVLNKTGTSIDFANLTKTNVPYLIRDKFTFGENEYYVTEKIVLPSGLMVSTDDTRYNGTLYLGSLSGLEYQYVFNTPLNFTTLRVSYDNPLEVKILGNTYYIKGVGTNSVTVMSGNVGIADATNPVTFGNYKIYAVDGSGTEGWVKLQIKDSNDNLVKTMIISTDEGEKDTGLGFKIKPLKIYTSTITNTVTAKLLVGTELEKTINNGDEFSGNWKWRIKIDAPGYINASNYIGVKYQPSPNSDDEYLKMGRKLVAPNGYFEIGYPKNVVDQFVKLEVSLMGSTIKVYPDTTSKDGWDVPNGLLISADSPVFGGETYSKVLIYWNETTGRFVYAYYDDTAKKYIEENVDLASTDKLSGKFDKTQFEIDLTTSEDTGTLTLTIPYASTSDVVTLRYTLDSSGKFISLGNKKGEAESDELNVAWAGASTSSKGTVEYDFTSPYGLVVVNPKSNGAADKVVVKIPAEQQKAYVYVGKMKGTTTAGGTYKTYAPLSLPVAKLASEVTAADKTNANIVLVGGPCANSLVQALVDAGKLDASMTCAGGTPGPAWTPGAAYVKVVEDAFATGKIALVVAGTNAADTRLATSLLSQGKLADQTASGVKVSGTVTAPVVTPM